MVCLEDLSRLVALQSLFTLVYVPVVWLKSWTVRQIVFLDWFSLFLLALKLTLVTRAVLEQLSVGLWPENGGSQFWLVLFITFFFLGLIKMIINAPADASLALVSLFFGMSFLGDSWASFSGLLRDFTAVVFHAQLSADAALAIGIVIIGLLSLLIVYMQWKGWVTTVMVGVLVMLDYVVSSHIVVYNIDWKASSDLLRVNICCTTPDFNNMSYNVDGNSCPLRFTWYDVGVFLVLMFSFMPLQFYRREQCIPLWLCCRSRARALVKYQKQKFEKLYGYAPVEDDSKVEEEEEGEDWMAPAR